jgi:hypothetical protein
MRTATQFDTKVDRLISLEPFFRAGSTVQKESKITRRDKIQFLKGVSAGTRSIKELLHDD